VIDSFIRGTRKKYLNVIQYFAVSLTLLGFQIFVLKTFFPEFLKTSQPESVNQELTETYNGFMSVFFDYQSVMYVVTLPVVAFASWLIFKYSKAYNYTEHIVINLYITAHYLVVSTVILILFAALGISFNVTSVILTIPFFIYNAIIFKKLYQLSFWETAARGVLILILYMFMMVAFVIIGLIIFLVYMKLTGGTLPTKTIV